MAFVFDLQHLEYICRILLAGICGMIIGIERKNRSKEAGTRTHFIVACGAALIMVVSKYAFFDVINDVSYNGLEVRLDPSRVASTIASGIGFLGAGMIFIHKNSITGLTTAAGIWATSGVGMAIGAGMYSVGIVSTIIIILAQIILHSKLSRSKQLKTKNIIIGNVVSPGYQEYIVDAFRDLNVKVVDVNIEKIENAKNYTFTIEYSNELREETIVENIEYDCIIST